MKVKQDMSAQRQMQVLNSMLNMANATTDLEKMSKEERRKVLIERLHARQTIMGTGRSTEAQKQSALEGLQKRVMEDMEKTKQDDEARREKNRKKREKKRAKKRQQKIDSQQAEPQYCSGEQVESDYEDSD